MNILNLTHFVIFPAKLLHSTSNGKPYLEKFLSKEFFRPANVLFSANVESIFVQILWEFTDLPHLAFWREESQNVLVLKSSYLKQRSYNYIFGNIKATNSSVRVGFTKFLLKIKRVQLPKLISHKI